MWFARTIVLVQYWRSMEQLMADATNRQAAHLPAWKTFNTAVGTDGSVGIWHQTYAIAAGTLEAATGRKHSARDRLDRGDLHR